ncbi:MAG TPA: hypothetical protein VE196_02795 [Pseudonocardiaceae bacterium]|nr:hypothetical protein [Pseudonocardiaceae bacterium]
MDAVGAGGLARRRRDGVLWPTTRWQFGPSPAGILQGAEQDIDTIRRHATQAMINAITSNGRSLDRRMAVYRGTVCVLMLELLVLLAALIFGRR